MRKMWYNVLLTMVLCTMIYSFAPAQTLSQEEQLRLQVLQLQHELVQERTTKLSTLAAYAQCVDAKFQLDRNQFDIQYQQAVQAWRKDIETKNPGFTWDLKENKFVPLTEK